MHSFKKAIDKVNLQRLTVALCILAVCVATQQMQTAAWYTGILDFSRDALGVLMAVILMTHYKWEDFKKYKVLYIVWSVVGVIGGIVFIPMAVAARGDYLKADTFIIWLGFFLMGYCVLHTLISIIIEKYRPKFYMPLFVIWVVMLLLMIFSRSDYLWPECYFVMFLCYYMTEQTPDQRTNVTKGLVDGMILAFIAIQVHSLLCRPYDRVRYYGNFCNPNQNCMFLCMCLAAILAKILIVTKENKRKIVKIFYFLMAGVCYSFIFMTMSHSGYLATFVVTVFFLIAYCRIREKKIFVRMGLLLATVFAVSLPVTYCAVRYIPTVHPHVLFYFQEGYSDARVHSWDDRQSPKYISFREMMQGVLGRFGRRFFSYDDFKYFMVGEEDPDSLKIAINSVELPLDVLLYAMNNVEDVETDPDKIPLLNDTREDGENSFLVRYTIYKWYFTHLSLRGMPYDEQGFQLTETHWIQDTHDIYLDYGINFGYPVMILFTVFIWWGIGRLVRRGLKEKDLLKLSSLMIALIPPVFGLFEFAWGAGMISTVALYLSFKEMFLTNTEISS